MIRSLLIVVYRKALTIGFPVVIFICEQKTILLLLSYSLITCNI